MNGVVKMSLLGRVFEIYDIHEMADYISNVLNKSVIIENKNFELIAYSSSGDYEYDTTQQKTILSKKCPSFIIERLEKEGVVQQLESKNDPIRVQPMEEVGFYQRVVIRVKYNERTVGYIWVLESNILLKEEELEFLTSITSHVGTLIYDFTTRNLRKESREHRLFWQLINHEYVNEKQIRQEANLASIRLPERFTIFVVSITNQAHVEVLEKVKKVIDNVKAIPSSSYLEKDSKVIFIVSGASHIKDDAISQAKQLVQLLDEKMTDGERKQLLLGIGHEYLHLAEMRKSFLQALEVIETVSAINDTTTLPVEYGKLGMYRYLLTLYEKNSSEGFINQDLLKLMKKDDENKTKLLETLKVYLTNHLKLKKTAQELFIHPNTLNYRIKQILESTDIDLEDFNMNSHLYTELLLLYNVPEYYYRYREALQYYFK